MNNKNKQAALAGGSFNNLNFAGGKNKSSIAVNYRHYCHFGQCVRCKSDYMKYASPDGYCQDCQQRTEFIVREHPHVINRVQTQSHGRLS